MRVRSLWSALGLVALLVGLLAGPAQAVQWRYAAEFTVEVDDFFFSPQEQFVNAGDTVNWEWVGNAPHNVTANDGSFASETQTSGSFSQDFDEPGEVRYFCTIHSDGEEGMVGVIQVLAEGEPLPEPGPEPRPAPDPQRLPQAADNVEAALAWSGLFAADSAPDVLLGRDDVFADSLSSGAVQGLLDAPLLLTDGQELDQRVIDELERLGAQTVHIFGGTQAISAAVEQQLRDLGYDTQRVSGVTRTETAIDVAGTFFADADTAILARSTASGADPTQEFADSLGAGGWAARALYPILFTQTEQLTGSTRTYLEQSSITRVFVVGGTAAISDAVVAELEALGIEVIRVSGPTRFHTALEVMFQAFPAAQPQVVILVDGQEPNAWASGFPAASAAESAPILLTNGAELPAPTLEAALFLGPGIICGPNVDAEACRKAEIAATSQDPFAEGDFSVARIAFLSGDAEVPGPGAEATGDAFILRTDDPGSICYFLAVYGLDEPVAAAHIHEGGPQEAGPVVVPLDFAATDFGELIGCAFDQDPTVVSDVFDNPRDYYVNLHTETFPDGAVRGQLVLPGRVLFAELSGDAEVPGPGADGGGFAGVIETDLPGEVCYHYDVFLAEPEPLTGAHIHEGGPDEAGPVVVPLQLPQPEGTGTISACEQDVDEALVADIFTNPGDYYVNLHTETFPDGAVRGQLFDPFAGPPPGA